MVGSRGLAEVSWNDPDGTADFGVLITPISDRTIDEWADGIVDGRVSLWQNFELRSRQVTSFQGFPTILMQSREQQIIDDCTSRATHLIVDGPYLDMWIHMKVCESAMDRLQPELDAMLRSFSLY